MGAQIEGRLETEKETKSIMIYDLVKFGNILADESINRIDIVQNPDGTRTVSVVFSQDDQDGFYGRHNRMTCRRHRGEGVPC
jgi:hypothetical protein